MRLFAKKVRVLIIGDDGPILGKLRGRVELFWPEDVPMKLRALFCGWADEAIDGIKDFRPDVLLLNHVFQRDQQTGVDVARWVDAHYRTPIRVAVHADCSEAELRPLYRDIECVEHFICGESVPEFIRACTQEKDR
ncbi:MAG: hypothetical protein B6D46_15735 [Polyangiaceae bacterium UTPRO1]|nr:hypothetical protein [Myxococcales bacterium]OQY64907.1 MAG: hypothetical protein B6D46_15735 [Polyangiaceae bacterium UTPRO1]